MRYFKFEMQELQQNMGESEQGDVQSQTMSRIGETVLVLTLTDAQRFHRF